MKVKTIIILLWFCLFSSNASAFNLNDVFNDEAMFYMADYLSPSLRSFKNIDDKLNGFLTQRDAAEVKIAALGRDKPDGWEQGCVSNLQAVIIYGLTFGIAADKDKTNEEKNAIWSGIIGETLPVFEQLRKYNILSGDKDAFAQAFIQYLKRSKAI